MTETTTRRSATSRASSARAPCGTTRTARLHWVDIDRDLLFTLDWATRDVVDAAPAVHGRQRRAAGRRRPGRGAAARRRVRRRRLRHSSRSSPSSRPTCPATGATTAPSTRRGRFWFGTMDVAETGPTGAFYRLDQDRTVTRAFGGVIVSNGPAWSPDGRTMYHVDSARSRITAYEFDPVVGHRRRRAAVRLRRGRGVVPGRGHGRRGRLRLELQVGRRPDRALLPRRPGRPGRAGAGAPPDPVRVRGPGAEPARGDQRPAGTGRRGAGVGHLLLLDPDARGLPADPVTRIGETTAARVAGAARSVRGRQSRVSPWSATRGGSSARRRAAGTRASGRCRARSAICDWVRLP